MADILIRGMEMPHNCFRCPLSYMRGERLFCWIAKDEVLRSKIAPDCPLHELPEHGDLISRKEALSMPFANDKYDHKNADEHFIYGCETYKEWLEQLPVVISSNKEDTK